MTAELVEARDLRVAYGPVAVLDGVDTGLSSGELRVVVGPNGAGKTTLVRVLSGIIRPDSGVVVLDGTPLESLTPREVSRKLAVVPQDLQVPFPYSVREMVMMGRAPHLGPLGRERDVDRAAVEQALARLGLGGLAERTYGTLSGGEKARVVLARALAQDAGVLLLDEPTAHMDLGHRVHTFEWLRSWISEAPERRGALIVTHDLALAARFADALVLMQRGRVVASGPPAEVITRERVGDVYGIEAQVTRDADGRIDVVAVRSLIRYTADPHEPDR